MPFAFAGSLVQGQATKSAANTAANATMEAARIAAESSRFRPVGVTGSFAGQPRYTYDAQGNVTNVDLGISPELQAYRQQLGGLTSQQLQQGLMAPQQYAPLQSAAGGLFDLSSRYLGQSPEEVAQKYIASQQDLLAPTRERQLADLRNRNFQTGREGLSVGGTGLRPGGGLGLSAANPEMEAYYNALAQQDLQLAAQAQAAGQQQVAFGTGLFGSGSQLLGQYQAGQVGALSPFQTSLGLGGTIEQMGQTPLDISAQLAGRTATAGANVGQALLSGGINAARTSQAGNAYNPLANVLQGVGTNPYLGQAVTQYRQPYVNAQQQMNQYGAENVYGFGGQGTVPTSVEWGI